MTILNSIKCFFGLHKWQESRRGYVLRRTCKSCGKRQQLIYDYWYDIRTDR